MTALRMAMLFLSLYSIDTAFAACGAKSGRSLIETNISGMVKSTALPAGSVLMAWNLKLSIVVALVITSTQNERLTVGDPGGIDFGSAISGVTIVVSRTRRNGLPRLVKSFSGSRTTMNMRCI